MMASLFEEKQRFTQWWLYTSLVPVMVLEVVMLSKQATVWYEWWPILITLSVFGLLMLITLRTVVTTDSVTIYYFPLLLKPKVFRWEDTEQAYVRRYNPLGEYGGWGIKGIGSRFGKAYNVKGDKGLQLVRKDGKKILIGTQRMEELNQVLHNHFKAYIRN